MTAFERLQVVGGRKGTRGGRPRSEPSGCAGRAPQVLEAPRFELVPIKGALEAADHLPQDAEVAISCSPTLGIENTLALAEELSGRGFRVVPHLSARLVRGLDHLRRILSRMEESGLREAFVVGGDAKRPAGPFTGGFELLEAMSRLEHGIGRIGIPTYPEPHPLIGEAELMRALVAKQPFASYTVTQICFDAGTVLDWLRDIRRRGVKLPVYVGVPGAVDRRKLLRMSLKIGIGNSVRYLRKQHGAMEHLTARGGYTPDDLIEALSPHVGDPDHGIRGFHINTFNQVKDTERWRRRMLSFGREEASR